MSEQLKEDFTTVKFELNMAKSQIHYLMTKTNELEEVIKDLVKVLIRLEYEAKTRNTRKK